MRKEERILYALNDIDDGLIAEAGRKPKRFSWSSLVSLAACAALLIGVFSVGFGGGGAPGGSMDSLVYDDYMGPVMPLTLTAAGSGLTAERDVTYDFGCYSNRKHDIVRCHSDVTDSYTLYNYTDADLTVEAVYPFMAKLSDKELLVPRIAVDGEKTSTAMVVGSDLRGDSLMDSGEKLMAALEDGRYFAEAFGDVPDLDMPCVVYHVKILDYDGEVGEHITLEFGFPVDLEKTKVLLYDVYGMRHEKNPSRISARLDLNNREGYVILMGEDLEDYTLQGYANYKCEKGTEVEGFTAEVTRTETTLGEWMASDIDWAYWYRVYNDGTDLCIAYTLNHEDLLHYTADQIAGNNAINPIENEQIVFLNDYISAALHADRMLYLRFPVTVPAGGSVNVTAQLVKYASTSHMSGEDEDEGYDLMTALGSVLPITKQTVRMVNTEAVELIDNNFGFDWDNGITEVTLDPNVEHYWMKVKRSN
ncbi:MAG: hypothetical protein IJA67_14710 [Oscillospiraceae bacterium]|nr:hypothetical protein [Oscillospiraceae bacterium]